MANPSTLYRFRIELSDVDRSLYESLDFRVAMHPSESMDYLVTRVLAYCLNFDPVLELLPGLCAGDDPALRITGTHGEILLWIDIGNPSPRRIHKSAKAARTVKIYTYKDPEALRREVAGEKVHRADEIGCFALDSRFLGALAHLLTRDNRWSVVHQDGELVISIGEESVLGSLTRFSL